MASGSNPSASVASSEQLARTAYGVVAENIRAELVTTNSTPVSQTVYAAMVGVAANKVVTGILVRNIQSAAGTLPTTIRAGIADNTGKMLALTGNLNSLAQWAAGPVQLALTAPYTTLTSGGFYVCLVKNGAFGTTEIMVLQATAAAGPQAIGAAPPAQFVWTGQTDLPAVSSSLTLTNTATATRVYYMGFY